jgi:Mor family transcriptional regulator
MMATLQSDAEKLRSEFFKHLIALIQSSLQDYGIDEGAAEQIALATANKMANDFGGQVLTIPKDHFLGLAKRDIDIFEAWRAGKSVPDLADETDLSARHIYRILDLVRDKNRAINEPQLF